MSSHSNASEAHNFFYIGVDRGENREYAGCTLSYEGCDAFSYSTLIAKVVPTGKKKPTTLDTSSAVTLLSRDYMSATTARHISLVGGASPFTVIRVPMRRGNRYFEPENLKANMLDDLEKLEKCLNLKRNREEFAAIMNNRNLIMGLKLGRWSAVLKDSAFKKYEKLDISKISTEIQERNRKAAVKKTAQTRAVLKKYLGDKRGKDYIEFIAALFDTSYVGDKYRFKDCEERRIVRNRFVDNRHSYVWIQGDDVVTSRGIRVPVNEAKVALMAWAHGKDMRHYMVNRYAIVKYQGNEIQIGCHLIPRENMTALYEAIIGRPFRTLNQTEPSTAGGLAGKETRA